MEGASDNSSSGASSGDVDVGADESAVKQGTRHLDRHDGECIESQWCIGM